MLRKWAEASCDWSLEGQESRQLKLGKQQRAKPVPASQSKGCGLSATSNGQPLQVSKQEWKSTKLALGKDHSSPSAAAALHGGSTDMKRQSRSNRSQPSERGRWPGWWP